MLPVSLVHDKMGRVLTNQRTTNGITNNATYTCYPAWMARLMA